MRHYKGAMVTGADFRAGSLFKLHGFWLRLWMTPGGCGPDDDGDFAGLRRVVVAFAAQVRSLQDTQDEHAAVVAPKGEEIAALKDEIARPKGCRRGRSSRRSHRG